MRKTILAAMFILFTANLSGQSTTPTQPLTRQDYLTKSKNQRTPAWILLGSGITMIALAAPGNMPLDELPILVIGGSACIIGSIPLFIAAGRNKRKANNLSAAIEIRNLYTPTQTGQTHVNPIPTFSIKLNL